VPNRRGAAVSDHRGSPRRAELLDSAYAYAVEHGLADLSLRPLAAATGTSPRVLLYLFGSKDDLVREILARSRREEVDLVAVALAARPASYELVVRRLWAYLCAAEQRGTIRLFLEAYTRSLGAEPGPWVGFAEQTIGDWVEILCRAQPGVARARAERRAVGTLALLRGLLLDLLARGDAAGLTRIVTEAYPLPVDD